MQETMHVAASDATAELQTKDKRIHHLERKVLYSSDFVGSFELKADYASRYNHCATNELPRPANSPSRRSISVD